MKVIQSWYVMGRIGSFNSSNLQVRMWFPFCHLFIFSFMFSKCFLCGLLLTIIFICFLWENLDVQCLSDPFQFYNDFGTPDITKTVSWLKNLSRKCWTPYILFIGAKICTCTSIYTSAEASPLISVIVVLS